MLINSINDVNLNLLVSSLKLIDTSHTEKEVMKMLIGQP